MKGLLLAGGYGTRLRPLTFTGNKHMIRIANRPMLFYGLSYLKDAGIRDVGIVLGPLGEKIMESVGDGSSFGLNVTYIQQGEPQGLAHAVQVSKEFLSDSDFVMLLGDNLLKQGISWLVEDFTREPTEALVALAKVKDPWRFGIAEVRDGAVVRLHEKPKEPKGDLAVVGAFVFTPKILNAVSRTRPSWRNELEITEAIQDLLDSGEKVRFRMVEGWWKDTGKPEDLLEANQLVLSDLKSEMRGVAKEGVSISGAVSVGVGTVIHPGTTIRGPVITGSNCQIGPDTFIGPYTSIGDDVVIRGGEIENSLLMDRVTLDCHQRIVDSIIGSGSVVSSGENRLPRGKKLFVGDSSYVSL